MLNNTCIVGLIDEEGNIWMGGDSAGVSSKLDVRLRKDSKVFIKNNMIFGYTSSFRMGQLLRYKLKIPKQKVKDDYEYMCTDFIDSVRKCLKDNGYSIIDKNQESIGTFLVGYKSRLYQIYDDLQVGEVYDYFDACGCGEKYAVGVLRIGNRETPEITLMRALETAEYFSGGVRRPFKILMLKK